MKQSSISNLCVSVALAMAFALPANADPGNQSADSMVIQKFGITDGTSLLNSLLDRVKGMRDYWYESTLTTYPKQKPVTEKGRFYFKTPNLVRFEALAAGRRTGSVVVRQPDGKIKAKAGGIMGGVTVRLAPNSKLLKTSNGYSIIESDLATLLEGILKFVDGERLVASPSPCSYPGLPRAYILELIGSDNLVQQRLALDCESKLPVEWLIFKKDKLDSLVHVEKLIVNANITDSLFVLGKETAIAGGEMKGLGSATLVSEMLQRKLSRFQEDVPLNSEIIVDIKSTIALLQLECDQLKNDFSLTTLLDDGRIGAGAQTLIAAHGNNNHAHPSGASNWETSGVSVLLIRTTAIESLAVSLRKVAPSIKNFDATTGRDLGSVALANQWQKSLDRIDESVGNLYAIALQEQKQNSKAILEEVETIKSEASRLEMTLKWISDLAL